MFKKLRTIIYHVDDLQKAKKWYTLVTGKQPYFDESFYVGFDFNGFELGLDPDLTGIREGNKNLTYWAVEDIQSSMDQLRNADAVIVKDITEVGNDEIILDVLS